MRAWRNVAILAALCVLMCAPLLVMIATTEAEMRAEAAAEQLISDKPMEVAVEAEREAEEAAQSEAEYQQLSDYAPVYTNDYWYESDDEAAEAEAKEWIAWRESGGDYEARNGQYVGRYQLNEMYLGGDYSEENQEAAAEAYIADRYGSWQAAQEHWREHGWY